MHIVFSGNNAWGMHNFRSRVLSHFVARGFRVTVLAPYDAEWFPRLEALGCEVVDLPVEAKGTNPLTDLSLLWKYRKKFQALCPDVSITYTIKPNIYGSMAAQSLGIPYLPVTTGLGYVFLKRGLVSLVAKTLYRLAFRRASRVWFLNRDDVETFRRGRLVATEKVEQLPGEGVDLEHFTTAAMPTDSSVTFLLIGRMLTDKGVREFVEAAGYVRRYYPNARFRLLGAVWKDNPAAISAGQLEVWEREGNVEYLGATKDVRPYIADVDCVVLPSYREGVPCTLMEAAAMGRPLVATDVPGCREVVEDGVTGYLCRVKDAASLADAMTRMIELPADERRAMGLRGRRLMEERFDVKHIIHQYDEAVDRLMKSRPRRHC